MLFLALSSRSDLGHVRPIPHCVTLEQSLEEFFNGGTCEGDELNKTVETQSETDQNVLTVV